MKRGRGNSKMSGILNSLGHFRRRKKERLYEQWVQMAGLPSESVPGEKVAEDITPKIEKERLQPPPPVEKEWLQPPPPVARRRSQQSSLYVLLYVLLGAAMTLFCMGLVFLVVQSC